MFEFSYVNQGTSAFLVYTMKEDELLDTTGIGMISNNKLPHILPISFTQIDDVRYLRYNISSRISLDNFFSGSVNRKRLLQILKGICSAVAAGAEYMLENEYFILDRRYIFANVATGEAELVYLPVLRKSEPLHLATFFKEIMFSTQFDSSEDCSYVARIINFLNNSENFSLKDFQTFLQNLDLRLSAPGAVQGGAPTRSPATAGGASPNAVATPKKLPPQQPIPVPPKPVTPINTGSFPPKPLTPPPIPPVTVSQDTVAAKKSPKVVAKEKKEWFGLFGKKGKEPVPPGENPASPVAFAVPGTKAAPASAPPAPAGGESTSKASVLTPSATSADLKLYTAAESKTQMPAWEQPLTKRPAQFGKTSVLNSPTNPTTVLSAALPQMQQNRGPFLRRSKTGERFQVNKILFRIGTERSFVDCCINDNNAVSHSHADIINRDGRYFVRDNNSTNHTYLNGKMIPSNQEALLENGAVLLLGNEEFTFEFS